MVPNIQFIISRGDLRRLNYSKTVFGRGFTPDPAGRPQSHYALPDPESDGDGIPPPIFLPSGLGTKGRLVLLLNWYLSLFIPKLRPLD